MWRALVLAGVVACYRAPSIGAAADSGAFDGPIADVISDTAVTDAPDAPADAGSITVDVGSTGCPDTFQSADVVVGSVTIATALDVQNHLNTRAITGDLNITLPGVSLPNLSYVGGAIPAYVDGQLSLPSLCYVQLGIYSFGAPIDLTALRHADAIQTTSPSLTSLVLPSLVELTGDFLTYSPLSTLEAPNLTTIGGSLTLGAFGDPLNLTSLHGLSALRSVRAISIAYAAELVDLTGLENVHTLPGGFTLRSSPKLGSLHGLGLAGATGGVALFDLPLLLHAPELGQITSIAGTLDIEHCFNLFDLELPSLQHAGSIVFSADKRLATLHLDGLTTTGLLSIYANRALTTVSLPALASADDVVLNNNDALINLSVNALTTARIVDVEDNALLPALALDSLTRANALSVQNNAALSTISAPHLTTINTTRVPITTAFVITGNTALAQIAFPALVTITSDASITNNPLLPTCQATALQAQVTLPAGSVFLIFGNGGGTCP
jgi:hypothetical protein